MTSSKHFEPGDEIAFRGVWRGKLMWACAAIVVEDSDDLIALFWRAGTPVFRPATRPTPQTLMQNDFTLIHDQWKRTDLLSLTQPGMAHSVDIMWEAGQTKLDCWYIQLQEPLRRTTIGFDTMDQLLDIVISPDRSTWHWKDEAEFSEAVAIGMYSPQEAAAIRLEGERIIERYKANLSPFCDGWEKWSPPEDWGIPAFPAGWDQVE
jgi:hypothetical protein